MIMQNKGQNNEVEISNFLYQHMFQISCLWFAEFLIDFKKNYTGHQIKVARSQSYSLKFRT